MTTVTRSAVKKRKLAELETDKNPMDTSTLDAIKTRLKNTTFLCTSEFFQEGDGEVDNIVKLIQLNHGTKKTNKALSSAYRVCTTEGVLVASRDSTNGSITAVTIEGDNYKGSILNVLAMFQHLDERTPTALRLSDGYILLAAADADDNHVYTTGNVTNFKASMHAKQFVAAVVHYINSQTFTAAELLTAAHVATSVVLPLANSGKEMSEGQSSVAAFLLGGPTLESYDALSGECRLGALGSVTSFAYANVLKKLSTNEKIAHLWKMPFGTRTDTVQQLQIFNPPLPVSKQKLLYANQAGTALEVKKLSDCSPTDFVVTTNKSAAFNQVRDFASKDPSVQVSGESSPAYERLQRGRGQIEYRAVEVTREPALTLQAVREALTKDSKDAEPQTAPTNTVTQTVVAEELDVFA